jgi:DNA modification methylase
MSKQPPEKWHNCYDDSWQGIIVPEAFCHPAKMAYGLTRRIFKHALSEAWIKPGDVVVDPFGGIGSTGIIGAYLGINVLCCELEEKFCKLAMENFNLHAPGLKKLNLPRPQIIQGDSRRLSEIETMRRSNDTEGDYGQTPGQLGAMKPGSIDAVVSSPPYAEAQTGGGIAKKGYGNGDMVGDRTYTPDTHGHTEGNLGNLKPGAVDAVVSSPPWESSVGGGGDQLQYTAGLLPGESRRGKVGTGGLHHYNEKNKHNLGNEQGETFWQAAKEIVQQCHHILKPGGVAIWVVKSFVRKGKIVDFPGDWRRLCESVGFETLCEHHAMLVKEQKQKSLFGHTIVKKTERKSFFRRLAESKGSPRIDYENVICMTKNGGTISIYPKGKNVHPQD